MKRVVSFLLLTLMLLFPAISFAAKWPGTDDITHPKHDANFLSDSSGLDFFDGKLYCVDNGSGRIWVLDVDKDLNISVSDGFFDGRQVAFKNRRSAKGADAEGITVDYKGNVYVSTELDRDNTSVTYNAVLMVNVNSSSEILTAKKEWDLTALLPEVTPNKGLEAIEWVPSGAVKGRLLDKNTGDMFDPDNYPNAISGVFFSGLEANGHIYAFVLNSDGSASLINELDPGLGGIMALEYDNYENALWAIADNGYNNKMTKLSLYDMSSTPIDPPKGLVTSLNTEGFAIADKEYTVNGLRPVFRFTDGVNKNQLSIGYMNCKYVSGHVHEYGKTFFEPTCTNEGYTLFACECGHSYRDNLTPAKGHTADDTKTVTTPTTCTQRGSVVYTCSVCNETYEDALDEGMMVPSHMYDEGTKTEPTCKEAGYTEYTCTVCGDKVLGNFTELGEHKWEIVEISQKETCDTDGQKTYTCSLCGLQKKETIQKTGHSFEDGACSRCGEADPSAIPEKELSFFQRIVEWFKKLFTR